VHHKIEKRRIGKVTQNAADLNREAEESQGTGTNSEKKFWIAMLLYGVLAIFAWYTIGAGSIGVNGRQIQIRLVPPVIFGVLALRTVLGRHADRIRREKQEGRRQDPEV
jgi:hypothetical protein